MFILFKPHNWFIKKVFKIEYSEYVYKYAEENNTEVTINVNNVSYGVNTNESGVAKLNIVLGVLRDYNSMTHKKSVHNFHKTAHTFLYSFYIIIIYAIFQ